jgi:hypothetical protein
LWNLIHYWEIFDDQGMHLFGGNETVKTEQILNPTRLVENSFNIAVRTPLSDGLVKHSKKSLK